MADLRPSGLGLCFFCFNVFFVMFLFKGVLYVFVFLMGFGGLSGFCLRQICS